jgi:hypothetical protein
MLMKPTLILSTLCLIVLTSCSTFQGGGSGNNTSRAQFLDEVWGAPEMRGKAPSQRYTSIYFAPVGVARLREQSWWASQSSKTQGQLQADAQKLARYMHNSFVTASRNHPWARLRVVDRPGPETLVFESAITELVPAKAFWNTAATAAGFAVPGVGLLSMAGKGAIGIEGRLSDGGTGRVFAAFRHRETDKMALLNLAAYSWYSGSEASIDEIAKKTAEILNTSSDKVVNRSAPIKLAAF